MSETVEARSKALEARSRVIDDLLALVELQDSDIVGLQPEPAPRVATPGDTNERLELEKAYDLYCLPLDGVPAERGKDLQVKRVAVGTLLSRNGSRMEDIRQAVDELAKAYNAARNEVTRETALRGKLTAKVEQAAPRGGLPVIVPGATGKETKALATERERLTAALATAETRQGALPTAELEELGKDVQAFVGKVDSLREDVRARTELRARLTKELDGFLPPGVTDPDGLVPGATEQDVRALLAGRARIGRNIADAETELSKLALQEEKIGALRQEKIQAGDRVRNRTARARAMLEGAAAAVDGLPDEAQRKELDEEHERLVALLDAEKLDDDLLEEADRGLVSLRDGCEGEAELTAERTVQRKAARERLADVSRLVQESCGDFKLKDVDSQLNAVGKTLDGLLYRIDFEGLEDTLFNIQTTLDSKLRQEVSKQGNKGPMPIDYLKGAAAGLQAEAARLAPFAAYGEYDLARAPADAQVISGLLNGKPGVKEVGQAFDLLSGMRGGVTEARKIAGTELLKCADLHAGLLARLQQANPPGLPDGYDGILNGLRTAVFDKIGAAPDENTTPKLLKEASAIVQRLERDLAAARDIAIRWKDIEDRFPALRDAARPPVKEGLQARYSAILAAGTTEPHASDLPAAKTMCDALAGWLDRTAGEGANSKGAKETLKGFPVDGRALDEAGQTFVYDLVGPDVVVGLQPDALRKLCRAAATASEGQKAALGKVVGEAFGADGSVLTGLLHTGDAAAILALADGLGGGDAGEERASLLRLLGTGGLAECPNVLGDMLNHGVTGAPSPDKADMRKANVAAIKSYARHFGEVEGAARSRTLLVDCGLGQPRPGPPPGPGLFAEALQGEGGLGGDAAPLRALADSYSGGGEQGDLDRSRLSGLVTAGGFAGHPRAFAPLLARIGKPDMAQGADSLKELGRSFDGDEDRGRLKKLLDAGGLSGDASPTQPGQRFEYPDTLAKVFDEGFGQDAEKLRQFAAAFGGSDAHAKECKSMLDCWNGDPNPFRPEGKRKPGDKIKRLLGPSYLNGDVAKLQTKFTTNIETIGDDTLRKQAYRIGPHCDRRTDHGWGGATTAMAEAGADRRALSLKPRHKPENYEFTEANYAKGALHSQFPPEEELQDVGGLAGLIDGALKAAWPGGGANGKKKVNVGGLLVEIAVGGGKVTHFTPHVREGGDPPDLAPPPPPGSPKETPQFTTAAMRAIAAATR